MNRAGRAALGIGATLALAGCSLITDSFATNEFSGDPFPIQVDSRSGGILVGLRSGGMDHIAVVDMLSPLTLIDPGPDAPPTIDTEDLTLLGERGGTLGMPDLPRARFDASQVLRLHPCALADQFCRVGQPGSEGLIDAVIGGDLLSGDALRIRLGDDQLFVLPDIGGGNADRTYACDAVFPSPYRGGGTLVVAGTEVAFTGHRITLPTCLGADADPLLPQTARGADVLLVMSTSIGPTLLSESAYERYRNAHPTAPPLSALPEDRISLPSGPITGRSVTIEKLALVARSSSSSRSACRQFYAHNLLIERNCVAGDDCPCDPDETFCAVSASVEVAPAAGLAVLVIGDDDDTLQALRTELRPNQAEVDGILGTGALRDLEVDIDYPHGRVLARCTTARCTTRPAIFNVDDRPQIRGCLGLSRTP